MTFRQLEYFVAIAELENITAASRVLNIAQPPLSYQLKLLEDELGVSLFTRNARNLKITREGMILREKATEIISMLNGTLREIKDCGKAARQTIKIGTVTSVSNRLLPERIVKFRESNPQADFQIWEGSTTRVLELLDADQIDIGLVREPLDTSEYNFKPVRDPALAEGQSDHFVAVGREGAFSNVDPETIKLQMLRDTPLILHRRFEPLFTNQCRKCGFCPNVVCRNDDVTTSLSWAEAGIGVAVIPYTSSMLADPDKVVVKKIVEPTLDARVLAIWKKDTSVSHLLSIFLKLL